MVYYFLIVVIIMIKTKSIYDSIENSDGTRILITRYWPRGIKKEKFDKWYKDLSPSKNLLKDYKEGRIDFQLFQRLFRNEIIKNKNVIDICQNIAKEAFNGKEFTLLCYEKDESNCHRKLIRKLCEEELLKLKVEQNIKKSVE
jgi:uncharacterized protein YeaO (DUF488 family)